MTLLGVTAETLSRDLGADVPAIYVVMAKHSVLGMDAESIKDVLGCTLEEVREVENDSVYKAVRMQIGALHAQSQVDQSLGLDGLEDLAIQKLSQRLPFEKDGEFLLKVLSVTNRATRRHKKDDAILDPTRANGRTAITLTQRLIKRISQGESEVVEERQLSIRDGSMKNPTFDEVDQMLSIKAQAPLPKFGITTQTAENLFEEFERENF